MAPIHDEGGSDHSSTSVVVNHSKRNFIGEYRQDSSPVILSTQDFGGREIPLAKARLSFPTTPNTLRTLLHTRRYVSFELGQISPPTTQIPYTFYFSFFPLHTSKLGNIFNPVHQTIQKQSEVTTSQQNEDKSEFEVKEVTATSA
ncbi:hypothetical protein N7536_008915 [Penicillium majusculum]|uniref:Uncharacterized protein n=1 Tax=Penicillium solitum TaxID=60172 RepID=A0A1V6R054_9EURO|nr:uncharacterized protein PENSOL_c024G05899 [Penicillium solitum]KAJ5686296.1 hypothetical protein N7536_008915 [Penicillium majusculum]OQD94761.1 hypothetical protein PENSOL_c024G05899 [Penicillium solitum]